MMDTLRRTFNFATPAGGVVALVILAAIVGLFIFALGGIGFRFDPFDLAERRADRAEQTAAAAVLDAGARTIEAAGADDTTTRVEVVLHQAAAAQQVAAEFQSHTRTNPDANVLLDPDSVSRLGLADQRLCGIRPVCPHPDAAPPGDARDGD